VVLEMVIVQPYVSRPGLRARHRFAISALS